MDEQEFKAKFDKFDKIFNEFLNKYMETNPELARITASQLIQSAILSLKHYIENPEDKEVTWDNPCIELEYTVEAEEGEDIFSHYFSKVTEPNLQEPKQLMEMVAKGFLITKTLTAFAVLTENIAILREKDKEEVLLPADTIAKLEKLSQEEKQKALEEIQEKFFGYERKGEVVKSPTLSIPFQGIVTDAKGRKRKFKCVLFLDFKPLIINVDARRIYYPLTVGLDCYSGYKPTRWSEKDRQKFWNKLLKIIKDATPEEKLDFKPEPLPEPRVKPVSKGTQLVKTSLHVELQKFGKRPKPEQGVLFDLADKELKKQVQEHKIEVVGVDLSQAQTKALFAIQRLLHETNYKGNLIGKEVHGDNSFRFSGYLPALKFSPAQYFEVYGVGKRETSRDKWEFNANERTEALKALRDLHEKRFLFHYERRYWINNKQGRREERFDIIQTIRPLITITQGYEALTRPERDTVRSGEITQDIEDKLRLIAIEPCPILMDQIDTYFVLKPANCYQEIKLLAPHASKYVYHFIDYLITQAELKRRNNLDLTIKISLEELAYKLRMDSWLKRQQWKQIRGGLNKCYETAKQLGYLLDYKTAQGNTKTVEELILNSEKYKKVKEIAEEIKQIEAQESI